MVTRRVLLQWPAGAIALLPRVGLSQAVAKVAWVSPTPAAEGGPFFDELRNGLRELGHVEGRNLRLDSYWAENDDALTVKAFEAAQASGAQVVVAQGRSVFAARKSFPNLPIVFGFSGDPVEAGLVQSMARPGGNLTGISYLTLELVGKRMQLLKETLPHVMRIAVIAFPQHAGDQVERRTSEAAARALGLTLEYFEARNATDLAAALTLIEKTRNEAVMVFPVQTAMAARERIAQWSVRSKIPTVSGWAQFVEGGNLMSYGPNLRAASFRLASFVDRILKGAKPADLPVEQPLRVELVVNARTAKALGVTIPPAVLLRADRVIE